MHGRCMATIGAVSNPDNMNISIGKAGRKRWMGRMPHNRGVSMNPIDHPHGGGEGRTSGGRHPVTPWGFPPRARRPAGTSPPPSSSFEPPRAEEVDEDDIMARSVWKGPFVDGYLLKKAEASRASGRHEMIRIWSRRSTILPQFVGLTFGVYNGQKHIPVLVTEEMVGTSSASSRRRACSTATRPTARRSASGAVLPPERAGRRGAPAGGSS